MSGREAESEASPGLAVAVTAQDSARTLTRTLESVRGIAGKIVVVDSGSTDDTPDLCRRYGAEVVHRAWSGYAAQKQFALDRCEEARWVLLLDSDESLEPDLQEAVRRVVAEDDVAYDGWWISRKVWFLGGWLHHTYQPDRVLRLVRGGRARMHADGELHERLEVTGRTGRLPGVCRHDSWSGVEDLATRQIAYARQAAAAATGGGTPLHLLINPPASMLKQLIWKGGFLDGARGLIAAGMTFNATMLKHAFIAARRVPGREAEA